MVTELPGWLDRIWLVPLLPLAGAVVLLLFGTRLRRVAGGLASLLVGGSFAFALLAFQDLLSLPEGSRTAVKHVYDWIAVGTFRAPLEFLVDPLSMVMILTVTGVSFLIHVYSIDYMHGDPRYPRYFAYLNLFVFSMVTLVLAGNYVLMYLGWELVGLCSYLLIAFWFEKKAAANAGKKAFIVNRIGDVGLALGIFLIFSATGSVRFVEVFPQAPALASATATGIALLLFAGAVGKSAQVPLHVWLPDAMEGPTPVSALIHAATMVTAGVYLVVRSHVLFEASGSALTVVAVVGTVTALYAATSALGQDDLKRVLAYSTISQLGFMFLAAGVRAYDVAIFFLVAHAFFKAVLFLAAGSVMHATGGVVDMRRLGGLWRRMPLTALFFLVGGLALAGVPPLVGFFAKDQALTAAYETGRLGMWVTVLVASAFTALYITRAFFLTFTGRQRSEGEPHESPPLMTIPMALLAAGAGAGGLLGLSAVGGRIQGFLDTGEATQVAFALSETTLVAIATAVSVLGILLGWFVYGSGAIDWMALRERLWPVYRTLASGWYWDDLYRSLVVLPAKAGAAILAYLDVRVIDGFVNGFGREIGRDSEVGRRLQTGFVRNYALVFLLGAAGILVAVLVRV